MITQHKEWFETRFQTLVRGAYSQTGELDDVIRYILSGEGKRVRALLTIAAAEAFGGDRNRSFAAAAAIEFVHAYSLVHDDLPCMDDDDTRRGRPTAHVAFNEANALLGGDAILADAFGLLTSDNFRGVPLHPIGCDVQLKLVQHLSHAIGSTGMVLGQVRDLYWTGRAGATKKDLDDIHLRKTGYLIGAACAMGAITAEASQQQVEQMTSFGRHLGLAYQIIDDLLDLSDNTGKSKGKDREVGKLTYLSGMTQAEAKVYANAATDQAIAVLNDMPCPNRERRKALSQYANQLLRRDY